MMRCLFAVLAICALVGKSLAQEPICDPLLPESRLEYPIAHGLGSAKIGETTGTSTLTIKNLDEEKAVTIGSMNIGSSSGAYYFGGTGSLEVGASPHVLQPGESGTIVVYAIPVHEGYHCGMLSVEYYFESMFPQNLSIILIADGIVPQGREAGDFDFSGCTDIGDFIYLLDNWGSAEVEPPLDINDFLALVDNWNEGETCL